jgi:radical SAM protein with 4Fe4S-binding SPASM domain
MNNIEKIDNSSQVNNSISIRESRSANRALNLEEFNKQSVILKSLPTKAWISLSGRCNLSCSHCLKDKKSIASGSDMSLDVFNIIKAAIFPYLDTCKFGGNNIGEQLIAEELDYFLTQIKQFAFHPILATNGLLLTKQKILNLIKAGWTIDFSTEGATQETYKNVRGNHFKKFISNVAECCNLRNLHQEAGAMIRLCFTIFYDNAHELTRLITLGAELGVDEILVTHFIPMREGQRHQSLVYHKGMANAIFKEAGSIAEKLAIKLRLPKPFHINKMNELDEKPLNTTGTESFRKCYHPWTSISVNEKGDIFPCCITYVKMGNLRHNSFTEIWNGKRYQKFRKTVNSLAPKEMCRNCSLRGKALTSHLCNNDDALLCIINPINHLRINPTERLDTLYFFRLKIKELLGRSTLSGKYLEKTRSIYKKLSF